MSHFYLMHPLIKKINQKKIENKINIDLAILPSHDTTPFLSFLIPRNFLITHSIGRPYCLSHLYLLLSILLLLNFLSQFVLSQLFPTFTVFFLLSTVSSFFLIFPSILCHTFYPTTQTISLL